MDGGWETGGGVSGPPDDQGIPGAPTDPPPTGSKWQGVEIEGECGRLGLAWVLVDEVCGGTDDPNYLDYFRAPMFRDGARIGDLMYSVDGTHLWVIDAADPNAMERQKLLGGLGEPLAVATYQGQLLIAAGSAGLLVLDLSNPLAPSITAQVALPGPALDIHVSGATALITMGSEGLALVDLIGLATVKTIAVPGFAAAVTESNGLAYVAACDTFAVIELTTGSVLGSVWLQNAYDGEFLVAPAKDVTLVGDVAFVAAGRFGTVAIGIAAPTGPQIIGNCTVPYDPKFYASGVRAQGEQLYVAAGEWGIMPVDVTNPVQACPYDLHPTLPELPDGSGDCSTEPPWEIVPWTSVYEPPPPGQDPIQTLPLGDVLYAFGDARRVAMRAIDVHDTTSAMLDKIGRYEEPRLVTGIAAAANRVLLIGPAGGLYVEDSTSLLVPDVTVEAAKSAVAAVMLEDGRWALATDQQQLVVEGDALSWSVPQVWPNGLTSVGNTVAVPTFTGAMLIDIDGATSQVLSSGTEAVLPPAIAAFGSDVVVAAPEWQQAIQLGSATALPAPGVFGLDDIMDASLWRIGVPRRILVTTDAGLAEIATLAGQAGLALHQSSTTTIALPPGTYVGGDAEGEHLYLVTADRGNYRSQLITVQLTPTPVVESIQAFTGAASGVAVDGARLYVADADRGVRVYDSSNGQLLGIVELEATP